MIGEIRFSASDPRTSVVLGDDLMWTSPDEAWADELNKMFTAPPVEGEPRLVTGRHLLYQTAARLGGTARQSQQSERKAALV